MRQLKIMVVDDDEPIRTMLEQIISERLKHRVKTFGNSLSHAIEEIMLYKPDIILLDFRMHGYTAEHVVGRLATAMEPMPKVILMTGYADEYHRKALKALGVKHILLKPFSCDELETMIYNIMEEKIDG